MKKDISFPERRPIASKSSLWPMLLESVDAKIIGRVVSENVPVGSVLIVLCQSASRKTYSGPKTCTAYFKSKSSNLEAIRIGS